MKLSLPHRRVTVVMDEATPKPAPDSGDPSLPHAVSKGQKMAGAILRLCGLPFLFGGGIVSFSFAAVLLPRLVHNPSPEWAWALLAPFMVLLGIAMYSFGTLLASGTGSLRDYGVVVCERYAWFLCVLLGYGVIFGGLVSVWMGWVSFLLCLACLFVACSVRSWFSS
ncbi:MAG: hypothetical protein Q7Q71_08830 [Verrucomicrobiota bacterium JB023]|nr:hypothetical protein [Verrucomicrobiota bacterium JB023]